MSELSDVQERITSLEQARKAAPVVRRLDQAAAAFRITPAERSMYGGHALQLSESGADWLLTEIESRPPIAALARKVDESERLDQATRSYMSERKAAGVTVTYKAALLHVSGSGEYPTASYSTVPNPAVTFPQGEPPTPD
ncbi:MAG: hypothetical protein ACYDCS_04155 [Candidatus Dormibacteria bacterium]